MTADRAVTAVVGKTLELALVVLFLGLLSTALFGGAVPEYRTVAGQEVGERALSLGAQRVQQAVPPEAGGDVVAARATARVDLPRTIRGEAYRVTTSGRALVLDHPHPGVETRTRVALPANATLTGTWESRGDPTVRVTEGTDGLVVRLDA